MTSKTKLSPGMQQYLDMKAEYPDAFLFLRMGDFYELFYEDAVNAAQILELTLTSRNKNADDPIPMAGVPHHAVQEYVEKLVNLGYKVAIADQMENPKDAVGLVKRAVTQVITPGTATDTLTSSDNNYLVGLDKADQAFSLAYLDLITGEFKYTELGDFFAVLGEIASLHAKEVVLGFELTDEERSLIERQLNILISEEFEGQDVTEKLIHYVKRTQMRDLSHLKAPVHYQVADFLQMDYATKSSLELITNKREGKKYGTLFWLLDHTKTAMGMRMLKSWIDRPLVNLAEITERQEIVQILLTNFFERADLVEALKGVYDLERLASRVSFGKADPVDLIQLANSLSNLPQIKQILSSLNDEHLREIIEKIDEIPELYQLIRAAVAEDAKRTITEGGIIRTGYNQELDKYREAMNNGSSWILDLEAKEKAATGISNLKIDFNKKDGFFFHVTQSQLEHVPDYFFRKATLKNSERYGTKELSEIEETILEAREKSSSLEYQLFLDLREKTAAFINRLQETANAVASVDCFQSLAEVAEKQQYIRPELSQNSQDIEIVKGRHAVIEAVMGAQEYVPNDVHLPKGTNVQLITGPNMSGKSTYMRQLALLVVMAQIGSFLPAESIQLPIFDAIYTRIGASDNLIGGESTFMVEMSEANFAIQHATSRSLILFDELGRGTATYDGMALAQSIIEYIHDHIHAKTLFATHYHELTELDKSLSELENVHVATLERNGEVTFLHKIEAGPADKSYGIHVAKIAGLPNKLLERADVILQKLENHRPDLVEKQKEQLSLFVDDADFDHHELVDKLESINPDDLSPREAQQALYELKDLLDV